MESLDQKNYNQKINYLTSNFIAIFIAKIVIIFSNKSTICHIFYENYIKIINQSLVPYKDFFYEYPPFFSVPAARRNVLPG